jgi:hypothetical protein
MENSNGTGIEYPTLELGGKTYTIKFSGSALYRLEKNRVEIAFEKAANGGAALKLTQMVDILHPMINFPGAHDELAELVFPVRQEALNAILLALGKAFPPAERPLKADETTPAPPPSIQ